LKKHIVIPAQAGIYATSKMDSRLRGNDIDLDSWVQASGLPAGGP
jgi:hypothetical protein